MNLSKYSSLVSLDDQSELKKSLLVAFYLKCTKNITEFDIPTLLVVFDQLHYSKPNTSRLKKSLNSSKDLIKHGMNTLAVELHPQAQNIKCTETSLIVELVDGRTISAPLVWFPRLAKAKKEQLDNWILLGDGEGIHWSDVDEDLSVNGLLVGIH